jgi:hypothetical protein
MAQESIESSELMKRIEEEEEVEEVAVAATQEKPAAAQRADAESSGDWAVGGGEEVWELASIPWPAAPVGKEAREGSASTTRGRRGHLASVYYHLILIWDVVQGECLRALEGHTLEGSYPSAPPDSTCWSANEALTGVLRDLLCVCVCRVCRVCVSCVYLLGWHL